MATKTWTSKADWDSGTLDDLYCHIGLDELEIAYDILTGKATYIFNAERMVNWSSFGYNKVNSSTIWGDDFRENSLSRYTIVGTTPTYNAPNHWLWCGPVTGASGVMLPVSISVKNVKAECAFHFYNKNNGGPLSMIECRFSSPPLNGYFFLHAGTGSTYSTAIYKYVAGEYTLLQTETWKVPWDVWRTHYVELNEDSLESHTDEGSISTTDGSITTAGAIRIYHHHGQGWMDNIRIKHYTLPSPANNSISFRFAISNDNVHWNPWVTDFAKCGNSRYIKVEVTLSRTSLASAMPVLKDMTLTYETRKQQPIFM